VAFTSGGWHFFAGADALVGRALGTVNRVILPRVGQVVSTGSPLFCLDLNGRALAVPSPVTGKVVSVNSQLQSRPELVAQAPYSDGWVCRIPPTRLAQQKTALRVGEEARAWLEREMDRLAEFLWSGLPADPALGATSLGGSAVVPGSFKGFDEKIWRAFEHEFLTPK
jgi:glycine cleavage system H protein